MENKNENFRAVSVIIPVYNAKEYLTKCMNSLLKQTMSDFEVIMVDDGSTDGSAELCDTYKILSNVEVIHIISNEGLSNARNVGLNLAKGKYIAFIDADDYVKEDYLEKLFTVTERLSADITVSGKIYVWGEYNEEKIVNVPSRVYQGENVLPLIEEILGYSHEEIKRWLKQRKFFKGTAVWARLYRRNFIVKHKLQFEKNVRVGEDMLFNTKAYMLANKIVSIDYAGYFYYRGSNGLINRYISNNYTYLLDNKILLVQKRDEIAKEFILMGKPDIRHMYAGSLVLSCGQIAIYLVKDKKMSFKEKIQAYERYSNIEAVKKALSDLTLKGFGIKYTVALFLIKNRMKTVLLLVVTFLDKLSIRIGL